MVVWHCLVRAAASTGQLFGDHAAKPACGAAHHAIADHARRAPVAATLWAARAPVGSGLHPTPAPPPEQLEAAQQKPAAACPAGHGLASGQTSGQRAGAHGGASASSAVRARAPVARSADAPATAPTPVESPWCQRRQRRQRCQRQRVGQPGLLAAALPHVSLGVAAPGGVPLLRARPAAPVAAAAPSPVQLRHPPWPVAWLQARDPPPLPVRTRRSPRLPPAPHDAARRLRGLPRQHGGPPRAAAVGTARPRGRWCKRAPAAGPAARRGCSARGSALAPPRASGERARQGRWTECSLRPKRPRVAERL
eukprot:scaffold86431_cov69-Phaeocystis_antarctica.AAC.3